MGLLDELQNSALPFIQKVGDQAKNVADQYRYITGAPVQTPQTVAPAANAAGAPAPLDRISDMGGNVWLQRGLMAALWVGAAYFLWRMVNPKGK